MKRKLREEGETEETGETSHIDESSEVFDETLAHDDIEQTEETEKSTDEVEEKKDGTNVEQMVVKVKESEKQEDDMTVSDIHRDSNAPTESEGRNEMMEVDEALEAEAPGPVVAAKPPKRRKKPKRLVAPRRKRVKRSPSYDIEEEELLLIESEYKRQIGEHSDSDASEELGEYSRRSSEDPDVPSTSEPKRGRGSRGKKE